MAQKRVAIFLEHLLGQREIVWAPNVEPDAIVPEADNVAAVGFDLQKEIWHVEVVDIRHMGTHRLALQNIDAYAHIILAGGLLPVCGKSVLRVKLDKPEIDLVLPLIDADRCVGALRYMAHGHTSEVHRGEQVAIGQEERIIQEMKHVAEGARGAERLLLAAIAKSNSERRAVTKISFDQMPEMIDGNDNLANSRRFHTSQ